MSSRLTRLVFGLSLAFLVLALGACAKKVAVAKPAAPPPPPPAAPTATLSASPSDLQKGQSTTLTWNTQNANDISIEGLGTVEASGTRSISPEESTTYRLVAKGPGGTQEADARVTVTAPPPVASGPTDAELFAQNVKDLYFDYDKYDVKSDEHAILKADAAFLAAHPNYKLTISGHCDERGSAEYNLALGSNRANSVRDQLVSLGVSADRIQTISYGKEKPFCSDENEQCWQSNRRAHFAINQ